MLIKHFSIKRVYGLRQQIYKGGKLIDNRLAFILKGKSLHIIQYWLPGLVLLVLGVSSFAYWGIPIRFVTFTADPGLTRGLLVLGMMLFVAVLMLIYWLLERRGVQLIPWLVWLHLGISLSAVLALSGAFCTFRTVSWVGGITELEASVVGFSHLSRPVFWLVVGQCVGIGHWLVLWAGGSA